MAAVSVLHPLQISFEFLVPTTGQWTNERHKQDKSGRNQREREVGVAVHDSFLRRTSLAVWQVICERCVAIDVLDGDANEYGKIELVL